MTNETLKPCPFCDGRPAIYGWHNAAMTTKPPWEDYYCFCATCDCRGPKGITLEDAVAAWNKRADDWQPIASAPKDETIIQVAGGVYYYHDSLLPFKGVSQAGYSNNFGAYDDCFCWRGESLPEHDEYLWHSPTHWKPLPKPPESEATNG